MDTIENRIVGFHTGRGGRYFNAGYVSFIGECKISDFAGDLFLQYENQLDIYNTVKGRKNLEEKYYECCESEDFRFFEKLGFEIGEKQYFDCGGNAVGLTEAEAVSGVGVIDIDGEYNTTVCLKLGDCSERQFRLIINYDDYIDSDIIEYAKELQNY